MFFSFEPHEKFEDLCDKVRAQWKEREGGKEGELEIERDRDRQRQTERDRERAAECDRISEGNQRFQNELTTSKMSKEKLKQAQSMNSMDLNRKRNLELEIRELEKERENR